MVLLYQLWLALSERKVMNKNRVNGSIVEKNEIWYARLYVTDENGKRKQIWRTTKLPVKNNKRAIPLSKLKSWCEILKIDIKNLF